MKDFICFGHRGAAGHEPENTLRCIEKGISLGSDFIELDVHLVEGELVVFHDNRLERTTNGSGYIWDASLSYIRSLDAGKGERVPLLREVLDLVDKRSGVNVELKGAGTAAPVASVLGDYIQGRGWEAERFLVASFDHVELARFRNSMPQVAIGALVVGVPIGLSEFAERMGASAVHASKDFLRRDFVEDSHSRGLKCFAYTTDQPEEIARMLALGVDGLFSNYPDRVISAIRS